MKKEIHIWDLNEMKAKIVVDLDESLRKEIGLKIRKSIYQLASNLRIHHSRLFEYFVWKKYYIPIDVLFKISRQLAISNKRVEKAIKAYKQQGVPSINSICNPIFPIKLTPYLTSLTSHLFFDGSVPKDGKGAYYSQKNSIIMSDFIKKTKEVFGDVTYSLRLDHRGVLKCRIPRIIGEICKYVYDINSFGSFDSRIPSIIFQSSKINKIAFIVSAIIDEGSITYDGSIQFGVSNKGMVEDFKRLCNHVGIQTTDIRSTKNNSHYYLYISSIKSFRDSANSLKQEYPLISLRHKSERLDRALEIKSRKFLRTKSFADKRKSLVLRELKKNNCSINHLANKLLFPPRTLRRYMYYLMKEKKISRKKVSNEYVYHLN